MQANGAGSIAAEIMNDTDALSGGYLALCIVAIHLNVPAGSSRPLATDHLLAPACAPGPLRLISVYHLSRLPMIDL